MKKELVAINTKSNGWIEPNYEFEKGKFLVFGLNNDMSINVYKREFNPNIAGLFACSLTYNYPMDDIIDYVYSTRIK